MSTRNLRLVLLASASVALAASAARAEVRVQCPGDTDGDAVIDDGATPSNVKCMHIAAGDGFVNMADVSRYPPETGADRGGRLQYIFGFTDVTGVTEDEVMQTGMEAANFPAPMITLDEGDEFYLTLTNVGMMYRPDLFDPHTVHWHGFPQASSVFDGVPEASISVNMGASLTYYYNVVEPGTYMYHCHVEATEHMQMGMLGNLYVRPRQNRLPAGTDLNGHIHQEGDTYVYNDGDGSTRYDVEYAIQLHSFDPEFHDASFNTQPLPFALMKDTYALLNGRGYPDTINPQPLANSQNGKITQPQSSVITAQQGQRILLRLSSLSVTRFFTLSASGLPMEVVGHGARVMKGGGQAGGESLAYRTNSVTLGGGEAADVIIDTTDVAPGTYFLHATDLNYLSNNQEDLGGMMTEIVIQSGAA